MRALFVINNPVYGGAHSELLAERRILEAAGWDVVVLTSDERESGIKLLLEAGVDVAAIPLHRLRKTWDPRPNLAFLTRFWPEVRAIRRFIRERRVDLVQVHSVINPHAAVAAHLEDVAVCWQIYDMFAPLLLRRAMMPIVRKCADSATVIGRALVAAHPGSDKMGDRVVVTSMAVDLDRFRPDEGARARARDELGIPHDAIAVGTVGNRFPNKGHLDLIEAARRLAPRYPNLVVRVLGAPSPAHVDYEARLQAAAEGAGGRVRLVDPGNRVPALLPALDVFVLTSRSEGMPMSIFEAMSCALPVIATDVGSVYEQVVDGVTGLLVPPENIDAVTVALDQLLADGALRATLGAAGRSRVVEEFGLEKVVATRLRAFDAAMQYRASRRKHNQRLRVRRRSSAASDTPR